MAALGKWPNPSVRIKTMVLRTNTKKPSSWFTGSNPVCRHQIPREIHPDRVCPELGIKQGMNYRGSAVDSETGNINWSLYGM